MWLLLLPFLKTLVLNRVPLVGEQAQDEDGCSGSRMTVLRGDLLGGRRSSTPV